MELTPQEREAIYLEEKSKRERAAEGCTGTMIVFNIIAALSVIGLYSLAREPYTKKLSIERIRKAYSGLAPNDIK